MQLNTARWAQIVFWQREDLDTLHRRENSLAIHCEKLRREAQRLIEWRCQDFIETMIEPSGLRPYWVDLDPGDQAIRIAEFERGIFPIWKRIEEEGIRQGRSDDAILHDQDIAIYESGWKVNRLGTNVDRQKKGKLSEMYSKVMG